MDRTTWTRRSLLGLGLLLALALLAMPLAAVMPPWGVAAYVVVLLAAAAALVRWHARHTAYRCPECSAAFAIDALTFARTPHVGDRKLLPCPGCGVGRWCVAEPRAAEHRPLSAEPAAGWDRRPLTQLRIVLLSCLAPWLASLAVLLIAGPPPLAWSALPLVALGMSAAMIPVYRYAARHRLRSGAYLVVAVLITASNLALAAVVLVPLAR